VALFDVQVFRDGHFRTDTVSGSKRYAMERHHDLVTRGVAARIVDRHGHVLEGRR
jgi:hypothetical protein